MRQAYLIGAGAAILGASIFYASGMGLRPGSFSLHMGAHLLLSLGAAPLLVLAFPRWRPNVGGPLAFVAFNLVTYGVHLPAVYARLMTPGGMFLESLLSQMAACALLGAAITFSRDAYAMTAPDDTALGGVLMWVVGGFVVMAGAFSHFMQLLGTAEARNEPTH
ncbi:hypothetical protein ACFP9V_21035 [Deinococcus radiopugnans]|uniref:Cytochrome c oxidase assembly factor CtaG n=1 Tax=Deinococcus radiopugnans ATCC 19172 TaxID=585398 RepID=A0A5C4YBK4_9DEIO|nr:cytochrome c oxidase assembly protein [Deinococcus radiopugnans]MBB6015214.1 cytochrome c oxidase assembly factor CtaG [Deinococcus radiopugnans ATCC 19172]TNM73082.1 cytochrome c oxidase assembly protein [Deinococcus radiopugnans ATCC 19172]